MKRQTETGLEGHSLEGSVSSGHIHLLAHSCVSPARDSPELRCLSDLGAYLQLNDCSGGGCGLRGEGCMVEGGR